MDVLSASVFDDKIAWYENTDGQGTFSSKKRLPHKPMLQDLYMQLILMAMVIWMSLVHLLLMINSMV